MEIDEENLEQQFIGLDSLLELLGNPTRRAILSKLAKVPHSAPELANDIGISRQAIHSQLKLLSDAGIIENIESDDSRGGKFIINSNLSVRIDITPNYYNIKYNTRKTLTEMGALQFEDLNCAPQYSKIQSADEKIKFLGDHILQIEKHISDLDDQRREQLNRKQCLLFEIKKLMHSQYKEKLEKLMKERDQSIKAKSLKEISNLSEEILFTMFFNPQKYSNKININRLMDDIFLDMDYHQRNQRFGSVRSLLEDMSRLMGFLYEDDDNWFFDF
jgi:predicted transcriptional regulator